MAAVLLYSSADLSWEEFVAFLASLHSSLHAQVQPVTQSQWASLERDTSELTLRFGKKGDFADFLLEDMSRTLGIPQRLFVVIEVYPMMDYGKASRFALEVACAFAEKWPCVVDNCAAPEWHAIRSNEELFQRLREGKGIF